MPQLTKDNITLTVTGGLQQSGLFDDGNAWCVPGVTLQSYTPAPTGSSSSFRNGCQLNTRGNSLFSPFDGRFGRFDASLLRQLPYTMNAGDVITVAKSASEQPWDAGGGGLRTRATYWPGIPGRSWTDEMMVLHCLPQAPTQSILRPPALGDTWSRTLALTEIPSSAVSTGLAANFPATIDSTALNLTPPDVNRVIGFFADYCGECINEEHTDQMTPDLQHPGYGQNMGVAMSAASILLLSVDTDISPANKLLLAKGIAQYGIDLMGAYMDGRFTYPHGGHMIGRKAPIILAGALLSSLPIGALMLNLDAALAALGYTGPRFQENQAAFLASPSPAWWFASPAWNRGWRFDHSPGVGSPIANGGFLKTSPLTWTSEAGYPTPAPSPLRGFHQSQRFAFSGYFTNTVECYVGQALAMRLLGQSAAWSHDMDQLVEQYVETTVPASVRADITAAGVAQPTWGSSGGDTWVGASANYAAAAWLRYG